jgi:putative N6-adenine-specific DNA methylase
VATSGDIQLAAVTAFGLEAVVARELADLGVDKTRVEDGRVWFRGDESLICKANLHLRSAERLLIGMGRFAADDFGALFDQTRDLPWERWIGRDGVFPVDGRSVRSQLHSTPDCQRLVKKAIAERLKSAHDTDWCEETGPTYQVEVSIIDDDAILTIDTSGDGLHKRGYRTQAGAAPLRETLAAALVQLSYWRAGRPFLDPFCGAGTIPIEAAMWARKMAPGLNRSFIAETWPQCPPPMWHAAREQARQMILPPLEVRMLAGDSDRKSIDLARRTARAAGVEQDITFTVCDATEWKSLPDYGCLITNPPYGERMGSEDEIGPLYERLGELCRELETWSIYILTGYAGFEKAFGRKADKRRKLYNAKIACTFQQFFGPKPPRASS